MEELEERGVGRDGADVEEKASTAKTKPGKKFAEDEFETQNLTASADDDADDSQADMNGANGRGATLNLSTAV